MKRMPFVMLGGAAWVAWRWFGFGWQASVLLALALWTPSTGFILDTLQRLGLEWAFRLAAEPRRLWRR